MFFNTLLFVIIYLKLKYRKETLNDDS